MRKSKVSPQGSDHIIRRRSFLFLVHFHLTFSGLGCILSLWGRQEHCPFTTRLRVLKLVPLTLVLAFVLAACGSNGGTSTGSGSTPAPTSTPTTASVGSGTSQGCPNSTAVNPPQSKPNVTLELKNSNSTITARNGDLIEIRLPFGQQWKGPTTSQGELQLQPPAGYALNSAKVCVWRFVAQGTGTTQLTFSARAICQKGQMCPQYILNVPFTINVK